MAEGRHFGAIVGDLREFIDLRVVEGFDDRETIIGSAVDYLSDEADEDALRPIAEKVADDLLAAHLRDQATWPEVTDCDRLDAAFAELTRSGIVARQNFSCCGNCGCAEIGDEVDLEESRGLDVRGYTFYHMQNTEAAASGSGLYLHYGACERGEDAALAIGRDILAGLGRHGLDASWNGRQDTCILLNIEWKRRRPVDRPE